MLVLVIKKIFQYRRSLLGTNKGKNVRDQESKGEFRIAVCQFEPVFLNKKVNLEKMEDMVHRAVLAGAQLIIFPECCITGYAVGKLAHEMVKQAEIVKGSGKGPSIQRLEILATDLGAQLIFGIPELVNSTIYNSSVHILPKQGVVASYHKMHMWETEGKVFEMGKDFSVRLGPAGLLGTLICYDLEFPEAARILGLMGAQVIVVSTANIRPWEESQRVFARARAMENCVYIAVANCLGKSISTEFFGGSIIVDPFGNVLTEAGTTEAVLVADINLEVINKAAKETDYLKKRRTELYKVICAPSK